jgi:23S rRNA pseudouridine1911/1915/1917 synthase
MELFLEIIAQKPMRLDKCLQEHLTQPRNQIEQFIKTHGVFVDGKETHKCGLKLKGGEKIRYELPEMIPQEAQKIDFDVEIIYEDEDLLIVNKPPGLTIHPAPSVKEPTLVDWLKHKGISLSTLSGEERHGIVHRIDKETSGALVVAKHNEAHRKLSAQLENRTMGRYYLALIDLPLKEDVIVNKPIGRNPVHRTKMAVINSGREAKSAFVKLVESKRQNQELIAAKLYTGRTHQIRVHLESLSRHIINDFTYGFKKKRDIIGRVMLHAYLIYFIHPRTGEKIIQKAPLFEDFQGMLTSHFDMKDIDEKIDPDYLVSRFDAAYRRL